MKFPGQGRLDEIEPRWFAVRTRYKSEKVVGKSLEKKRIEHFIPIHRITRRYSKKIKTHEIPLINCYVFVKIAAPDYVPVLETEHVVGFVRPSKELIDIPENELEIFRRIAGENFPASCEPGLWQTGDSVEILSGNLAGLKGFLLEKSGKHEFIINLENFGHLLRITIDASLLRKL